MTRASDPIVRTRGIEALGRRASDGQLGALLPSLCRDRPHDVRRRVFVLAETRMPEMPDRRAHDILFDRNMWLREFARQRLKKQDNICRAHSRQ